MDAVAAAAAAAAAAADEDWNLEFRERKTHEHK